MRGERRGSGPSRRLLAALADLSGGEAEVLRHDQRPWASVTFSGARHNVRLRFTGVEAVAAGEQLISALPDHEFTLPGHVVIEATVISVEQEMLPAPRLTLEAELLLLEDA